MKTVDSINWFWSHECPNTLTPTIQVTSCGDIPPLLRGFDTLGTGKLMDPDTTHSIRYASREICPWLRRLRYVYLWPPARAFVRTASHALTLRMVHTGLTNVLYPEFRNAAQEFTTLCSLL